MKRRKNLMERLDRTDFRDTTTYIEGRMKAEHFRLCVEITDTLTREAIEVIDLFADGLYIVNPNYNWSRCKDTINVSIPYRYYKNSSQKFFFYFFTLCFNSL